MKKNILIAAVAFIALSACKKDYTCECTRTSTSFGNTNVSVQTNKLKEVSKKTVKSSSECVSHTDTYTDSDGDVYTSSTVCVIKKWIQKHKPY